MMCGKLLERGKVFLTCADCAGKTPINRGRRCKVCSTPLESVYGQEICHNCRKTKRYFEKACTPFIYEGGVKNAIKGLKFRSKNVYAAPLAAFMFTAVKQCDMLDSIDVITYVPIHFNRLGERGYNQSQLLAESISEFSGVPVYELLKKTVDTKPLSMLRTNKRAELVKGVFALCENEDISDKNILLIDDIITTGSTANECAKVLRRGGAASVRVAAVASTRGW